MKLGRLKSYTCEKEKIYLEFAKGKARLEVLSPKIIRVFVGLEDEGGFSYALSRAQKEAKETGYRIEQKSEELWIHTGALSVRVSDDFYVDFYDRNGEAVCRDYRGERHPLEELSKEQIELLTGEGHAVDLEDPYAIREAEVVKCLDRDTCFYGLGDKTGYMNKRHYDYMMWNTDDPSPHVDSFKALYKSSPFS